MEAIYEFDVVDMPVTVAVDSEGDSIHKKGPKEWRVKIKKHRNYLRPQQNNNSMFLAYSSENYVKIS